MRKRSCSRGNAPEEKRAARQNNIVPIEVRAKRGHPGGLVDGAADHSAGHKTPAASAALATVVVLTPPWP